MEITWTSAKGKQVRKKWSETVAVQHKNPKLLHTDTGDI